VRNAWIRTLKRVDADSGDYSYREFESSRGVKVPSTGRPKRAEILNAEAGETAAQLRELIESMVRHRLLQGCECGELLELTLEDGRFDMRGTIRV